MTQFLTGDETDVKKLYIEGRHSECSDDDRNGGGKINGYLSN